MKNKLALVLIAMSLSFCACRTTDSQTDPATAEQIKAALEVPVASAVKRVIQNSPQHSTELANYFKGVRDSFCAMKEGQLTLDALIVQLNTLVPPTSDPTVTDAKNLSVALLRIWAARHPINLTPAQWLQHVSETACRAVGQGIIDAGF